MTAGACLKPEACDAKGAGLCRACNLTARNKAMAAARPRLAAARRRAASAKPAPLLTAELFARAIGAAAMSYGDDPVEAVTSRNCQRRRALTAAALGVSLAAGVTINRAARVLGFAGTTVNHAKRANRPEFWRAAREAEAAARWHLTAHPLRTVAPTSMAEPEAAPRPTAKALGQRVGFARSSPQPEPAAAEAAAQRVADIFDAFRRSPPPGPCAREPMAVLPPAASVVGTSMRSGSRTVGRPAPRKDCGSGKANGVDPEEFAFVRAKRAANVPWSAISNMTGKTEIDLRRRYDPTFAGVS